MASAPRTVEECLEEDRRLEEEYAQLNNWKTVEQMLYELDEVK